MQSVISFQFFTLYNCWKYSDEAEVFFVCTMKFSQNLNRRILRKNSSSYEFEVNVGHSLIRDLNV